jgi:hypothetical protein
LHVDTELFQIVSLFEPIGHDFLHKLRHGPQELQLPHKPPRHEKNADTDPDGEQHREHRTTHPVEPAAAIAMNAFFISISSLLSTSRA